MSETKLNKIIAATTSNQDQVLIETFRFEDNTNFENELLFFFKPETFLVRERDGIASILQMVFRSSPLSIHSPHVLSRKDKASS